MIDTGAPFRLGICNVVTYAAEPDSAVWRVDFECGCVGKYVCDESDDYFGWDGIAACREHERPDLPGRFNYALAYSEMEKILIDVQTEYGLGGLSDGLYADYASDVARRYAALLLRKLRFKILSQDEWYAEGDDRIRVALDLVGEAIEETGEKLDA